MHFLIYKITNLLNNRIYIGLHKTDNDDDSYMGSSKILAEDIKNLGIENFKKDILFRCSSEEEMEHLEESIVDTDFLKGNVYNQMPGGKYGSKDRNGLTFLGRNHSENTKIKIRITSKQRKFSVQTRELMSKNNFSKRNPEQQKLHAIKAGAVGGKAGKNISRPQPKGENSPNFGLKRETIECPHCGKSGAMNTMSRWHYDKCKLKKQ